MRGAEQRSPRSLSAAVGHGATQGVADGHPECHPDPERHDGNMASAFAEYEAAVGDWVAGSGASIGGERSQDQAGDMDT
jgi:hypothetical protein